MSSLQARAAARTTDQPLDVNALRILTIYALEQFGERTAKSLRNVEHRDLDKLHSQPVAGTILEPAAAAIREAGALVETVGDFMRTLEIDRQQLHDAVCYCHEGDQMTGGRAAANMKAQFAQR